MAFSFSLVTYSLDLDFVKIFIESFIKEISYRAERENTLVLRGRLSVTQSPTRIGSTIGGHLSFFFFFFVRNEDSKRMNRMLGIVIDGLG